MSFFFKSKKQDGLPKASRNLTSADGYRNATPLGAPPPISAAQNGSPGSRGAGTPTPEERGLISRGDSAMSSYGSRNGSVPTTRPAPEMSLYPWSQRQLAFNLKQNPFPRYGAAINTFASKDGDIYLMGGLIGGSMVKGDLWIMEAGSPTLSCYPVSTTAEGPGPRVGHASLLVGNAFIVFGGDTKIDEMDVLDDTLYLLNTSTKHWSRALPSGSRPSGRYGHTLNILGSKIYIFGGQVEGFFFNDLVAFDLNALQQPQNRWEVLIQNTTEGGPPQGSSPPARTNHTVVTWNDRLFLFGGTDGMHWFNDVWTYDPRTNAWTPLDCIGFIPTAREGHSAALVGDVMYVFGGRTEEGKDLGDLAAFRIPTRRWYTFQNMGPAPSPRSGHGMTAYGNMIYVLGGEPSSAPSDPNELSLAYVLDTSKIRYPNDAAGATTSRQGSRRPSVGERDRSASRDGSTSRDGSQSNGMGRWHRNGSDASVNSVNQSKAQANPVQPLADQPQAGGAAAGARQPQGRSAPIPNQPGMQTSNQQMQQQQQQQVRPNGVKPPFDGPDQRFALATNDPQGQQNAGTRTSSANDAFVANRAMQGQYSYPQNVTPAVSNQHPPQGQQEQQTANGMVASDTNARTGGIIKPVGREGEPAPLASRGLPVDSGVGSSPALVQHNDEIVRELESIKSKNVWYASELALARKAGYRASTDGRDEDTRSIGSIGEDERPLVEALLKMRTELVSTQESFKQQTEAAARQIGEVERQRDAAIAEVAYVRTKHAARGTKDGYDGSRSMTTPDSERSEDANRRLAAALSAHNEISSKLKSLTAELESERKARQLAEESADVAHSRASELDVHKQQHTSELEQLRTQLHEVQKAHREEAASRGEAESSLKMLEVDKNELTSRLNAAKASSENHTTVLAGLREAVTSSTNKANLLEKHLDQERKHRNALEEKIAALRSEHETRVAELESTQRRLEEAEQIAASHAAEAKTHRDVVLAGFGKTTNRDGDDFAASDQRVTILQQQLDVANGMVRQNQESADKAADELRKAETRIAGLLSFQEQQNREGLRQRRDLQLMSTNAVTQSSKMAQLQDENQQLTVRITAVQLQHDSLQKVLRERGLNTDELVATAASNNGNAGERLQELEQQLEASMRAHEDMRASFEQREHEANRGWENKLSALDNDYQSAVRYLKITEKMLNKMKNEAAKYKTQNKDLEEELSRARAGSDPSAGSLSWESERSSLQHQIEEMQNAHLQTQSQLQQHMEAARSAAEERDRAHADLAAHGERSASELQTLRAQNNRLEERATEAERKVQMLLDTVGTTVNNYRHSQQLAAASLAQQSHNNTSGVAQPSASHGHSRGLSGNSISGTSDAGHSEYSLPGDAGNSLSRNSMALDSLANELETLRTHWETTNKNYRLSDRSDIDKTPTQSEVGIGSSGGAPHLASPTGGSSGLSDSLATWRRKLELEEHGS